MADTKITDLSDINLPWDKPSIGELYVNNDNGTMLAHTGTEWEPVANQQNKRLHRIEKMLEKIADRLAILDEPDEERLEQFKTLQDIYKKYKFTDALCGKKEND